jgi:Uma2 family endonuclease
MIDAGVLTDDDPVELLEGILVFKMPKKPNHRLAVRLLTSAIDAMLPAGWHFQAQEPITLEDGEPEPDGAVIRGQPRDYGQRHPGPGDVALVIEVSDTTLERDRGIKLRSYARAGIPVYWIIDLASRSIEVCSEPDIQAESYRSRVVCDDRAILSIASGAQQLGQMPASQVLP